MRTKIITKNKLVFFITFIILTLNLLPIPYAKAEMNAPSFKIGDKWQYNGWTTESTIVENGTGTFTIIVKDKKNIFINEIEYLTWELETKYGINPLDFNQKTYYEVSTLKQRKTDYYEAGYWATFPKSYSIWPIKETGEKEVNITRTKYDGEKIETKNTTYIVEYIGQKTIETKVGKFNCLGVKTYKKNETQNYTTKYYSQNIGWFIKKDRYKNNIKTTSTELIAYETHNGSAGTIEKDNSKFNKLSDYTLILVALLIILITILLSIVYLYKKFKKNN
jgi:hypothetical protein